MGLSWWLTSKESICNAGDTDDAVWSLGGEDPLEEEMETHSGYSPRGHKELDTTDHKHTGAWLAYSAVLSFRFTTKWFSSTHTYIHPFSDSFLI